MNKYRKLFTFILLLFFIIPIATAFCCCADEDSNHSHHEMSVHDHGVDHSHHDHGSHHHGNKQGKASPDSCECGHEIIGDLATTTIDLSIGSTFNKFQAQHLFISGVSSLTVRDQGLPFHDTGPPGQSFFSLPLYLQISVLRI